MIYRHTHTHTHTLSPVVGMNLLALVLPPSWSGWRQAGMFFFQPGMMHLRAVRESRAAG